VVLLTFKRVLLRYPHHIEGEPYLALNLLGSEQKMAAYSIAIPRNGNINSGDLQQLGTVQGSPFAWGRQREGR
jgi:hypothetical protein